MKFRFVLVILCLFLLSLPSFAQDTQTAEWGNLGLEVEFPDDWDVDDSGENALLIIYSDDLAIFFYSPREADDPEEAIEQLVDNDENTAFDFGRIEEAEVMGEEAFRVDYESDGFSGFSLSFEYEGDVLLLDAGIFDDRLSSRDEDTLLEIIETIQPADGGGGGGGGGDTIETAADEDSSGEDIVEELIDLGLVEDGGDFLFEEDEVDEDTQDLSESYEGGKIAMGALVSFDRARDDEEYRVCGFIAQSSTDDMSEDEGTLLITGMDSDSAFVTFELDIEDIEGSIFEAHDSGVDVEDTNHILAIIQDDQLSAWVNGEMIVEEWELDISAGDDELFAGFLADLGCEMTNVWAYSFE